MPLAGPAAGQQQPTLVVVVTVDQLRGDYLDRFAPTLEGGLRRFRERGAFFPLAEQDHANTSTAPGHSTILSGRVPAATGILSNDLGVPDPGSPLIGGFQGEGASPHRFRGTTLYDWMLAADPETRALSVGRKDRGAILPMGAARTHIYWWAGTGFTTSSYYRSALPDFVQAWNAGLDPAAWQGRVWSLLLPDSAYPEPDAQPWEGVGSSRGSTFPHTMAELAQMERFPWADSLTLDLALQGTRELALGRREGTDLLAIALSTLDVVGHHFGPQSRAIPPSYGWLAAAQVRDNWVMTTSIQATHGSWTQLDRSVPIAFMGAGIQPRRVERMVATVDIAPTLARLLGVRPTEPLDGTVLPEVVR
jgi:predicted AlkP superfamily pyrophosphatase or phosphodiesterase